MWSDVVTRLAGYLILADDWNDVINNLKHLRGQDGTTVLEGDLDPETDLSQDFGSPTNRWKAGFFDAVYASNGKRRLHSYAREIVIDWSDAPNATQGIDQDETAGGTSLAGGSGCAVLKIDADGASLYDMWGEAEQNTAKDTSFNVDRSPYLKAEISMDVFYAGTSFQIGWEDTPVADTLAAATDALAMVMFLAGVWTARTSDGAGAYTSTDITASFTADQRHVIEILVISAGNILFYVDGTLVATNSALLPAAATDLEWAIHYHSDGLGGGGVDYHTTLGQMLFQEDLA